MNKIIKICGGYERHFFTGFCLIDAFIVADNLNSINRSSVSVYLVEDSVKRRYSMCGIKRKLAGFNIDPCDLATQSRWKSPVININITQ